MAAFTPPQSNHNTPLRPGERDEEAPSPSTIPARLPAANASREGDVPMAVLGDTGQVSEGSGDDAESGNDVEEEEINSDGEGGHLEGEVGEGEQEGEEADEEIATGGVTDVSPADPGTAGDARTRPRKDGSKRKKRSNGRTKIPGKGGETEKLPEARVAGKETRLADMDHLDRLNRIIGDVVGDYDPSWE